MSGSVEDQHRFEALYDTYRLRVLAYCARRVSQADAADACSETFVVAWRRLREVPGDPKTLPYLYGIAARVLSNQRRALQRRVRLQDRLRGFATIPPEDPDGLGDARARRDEVVAAVRRLSRKDREIVMLAAWEDLPREEIAELMGMSRAAIDQRIHRAYGRLARALGVEGAVSPRPAPRIVGKGCT